MRIRRGRLINSFGRQRCLRRSLASLVSFGPMRWITSNHHGTRTHCHRLLNLYLVCDANINLVNWFVEEGNEKVRDNETQECRFDHGRATRLILQRDRRSHTNECCNKICSLKCWLHPYRNQTFMRFNVFHALECWLHSCRNQTFMRSNVFHASEPRKKRSLFDHNASQEIFRIFLQLSITLIGPSCTQSDSIHQDKCLSHYPMWSLTTLRSKESILVSIHCEYLYND